MTEPSQYFKGRTVQEQMNEVIGYVDVRSAEVATDAIAADVAQVHQDMLDADADAAAAAASAAAAAGTLANAVKKTGEVSQSIAGDIAVAGDLSTGGDLAVTGDAGVQGNLSVLGDCDFNTEVKVRTPVNNTDAANKKYVDDQDAVKLNITDVGNYAVLLTGNQTKQGQLTFADYVIHPMQKQDFAINQNTSTPWIKLFEMPTARRQIRGRLVSTSALAFFIIDNSNNTSPIVRMAGWGFSSADFIAVTYDEGDTKISVWFKAPNYASEKIFIDEIGNYGGASTYNYLTVIQNPVYVAAPTGDHVTYSSLWTAIQ